MPAPTVVILAAGRGTRMRSATPKLAHDLCGRPLLAWPVAAAREPPGPAAIGRRRRRRDGARRSLLGERRRARRPGASRSAPPTPSPRRGAQIERDARRDRARGRRAAGRAPSCCASSATRTRARGAAATMVTTVLDDPRGYGRVVRDADGEVERVVETKVAGDASAAELAIREVNAGDLRLRRRRAARRARRGRRRQRAGRALPARRARRCCARAAPRSPRFAVDDPAVVLGVNDRVRPRRGARRGAAAHPRAPHARRRDDRRSPRRTTHRRRRRRSARTRVIEPCTQLRGATRDRRAARPSARTAR